jgi:hypothetical protein
MNITKDGWLLRRRAGGQPINQGDVLVDFRGEHWIVQGGTPPHRPGTTGKIRVSPQGGEGECEFYASVFDCEWVDAS